MVPGPYLPKNSIERSTPDSSEIAGVTITRQANNIFTMQIRHYLVDLPTHHGYQIGSYGLTYLHVKRAGSDGKF